MEKMPTPPVFVGNDKRREQWERPVKIVNALEELEELCGFKLPKSLQKVESRELSPKQLVDIDDRALRNPKCPNIIFGRPHAGEYFPEELWKRMDKEKAGKTLAIVDRGTDNIFRSPKIASVGTKISRLAVDPNRVPSMGQEDPHNKKAIGKVVWKEGIFGESIYNEGEEPNDAEAEDLVENYYLPYYNAMMAAVGTVADRRESSEERILVIDGHSCMNNKEFDWVWKRYEVDDPEFLPLFLLGDQDGKFCDPDIMEAFAKALEDEFEKLSEKEKAGLLKNSKAKKIIAINEILKGVHNVNFYGQRREGINAIQLEVNEASFVDCKDNSYYDSEYNDYNMRLIQRIIERASLAINSLLKNETN